MKKALSKALIILFSIFSLAAEVPESAYSYDDLSFNALYSPSYFGRFEDSLINPAALSRNDSDNAFYFSALISESWDTDVMRRKERLYGLQNLSTELRASFVGRNLSLTAVSTTWFADRQFNGSSLVYDIYNRLGIQVDYSASFDFFSFGLRIKGGGDMRRSGRQVSGIFNAIEHAYFGSFDAMEGSEYFELGAALAFDFDFFTVSYFVENVISYRSNDLYFGWNEILDSSYFSFSLRYPEFTGRGELNFLRPRIGYTIHGNLFGSSTITASADLEAQLLPDLKLHLAFAYREYGHRFFAYNSDNGVMMFSFSFERDNYSFALMCNVDTSEFRRVYPSLTFTLSR